MEGDSMEDSNQVISLQDIVRFLRKHLLIIAAITLTSGLIGTGFRVAVPKRFTCSGLLEIGPFWNMKNGESSPTGDRWVELNEVKGWLEYHDRSRPDRSTYLKAVKINEATRSQIEVSFKASDADRCEALLDEQLEIVHEKLKPKYQAVISTYESQIQGIESKIETNASVIGYLDALKNHFKSIKVLALNEINNLIEVENRRLGVLKENEGYMQEREQLRAMLSPNLTYTARYADRTQPSEMSRWKDLASGLLVGLFSGFAFALIICFGLENRPNPTRQPIS
jgi:hypothetical protein